MSIKKVVQTFQPLRETGPVVRGETIAVPAGLIADALEIVNALNSSSTNIGPHEEIELRPGEAFDPVRFISVQFLQLRGQDTTEHRRNLLGQFEPGYDLHL